MMSPFHFHLYDLVHKTPDSPTHGAALERDARPYPRAALTRNSTLPSGPLIGLSTMPSTRQPELSSQPHTSSQTRRCNTGSRTTPPLPTSSDRKSTRLNSSH